MELGKSLLCFNFASYLSSIKHKKCLILDLDYQANISSCYSNKISKTDWNNSKIVRAFKVCSKSSKATFPKNFKPAHINTNLDIFVGSRDLENVSNIMRSNATFAPFVLIKLFNDMNASNKYDYILIDCHNNFLTLTKNALIASRNGVFVPVNPGKFEIEGIKTMMTTVTTLKNKLVNPMTQQSFIVGNVYFLGNKILSSTRASRSFVNATKSSRFFIANFPRREIFPKALENNMSVFEYAKNHSSNDRRIVESKIQPGLENMYKVLNK